ncbi:hypothetical protein RW26_22365 [Aeromonas sp. L_1B5_3]|nr:hypothetical protein RW26_22365 [Aeromonas sp. L_1B5_3]
MTSPANGGVFYAGKCLIVDAFMLLLLTSEALLSPFATKNIIFHKRFTMSHGIMLVMNSCLDS